MKLISPFLCSLILSPSFTFTATPTRAFYLLPWMVFTVPRIKHEHMSLPTQSKSILPSFSSSSTPSQLQKTIKCRKKRHALWAQSQNSLLISFLKLLSQVTLENYLTWLSINFLNCFTDKNSNILFKKLWELRHICKILYCLDFFK